MITRRYLLGLLTAALSTGWAQAEGLSGPLEARLVALRESTIAGDYETVFDFMPPRTQNRLVELTGCSLKDLRAQMSGALTGMFTPDELAELEYSSGLATATFAASSTGRPYCVAQSVLRLTDGRELRSPYLIVQDEGQWYIIRVPREAHLALVDVAYPDLAGLQLAHLVEERL